MPEADERADYLHRLAQAQDLESRGINPYPAEPPKRSHTNQQLVEQYAQLEGGKVSAVGRMVAVRDHGNMAFTDLDDGTGLVQAVIIRSKLGDSYPVFKGNFGEGDFVGVTGDLRKTKAGEVSVWADEVTMLTKALRTAPLKIYDPEIQQRQRYLHTLVDLEARKRFRTRSQLVQMMRDYFINIMGCLEVETPVLDYTYGGALARPFTTYHRALGSKLYLRIANELYLKRMTTGGYYEGVFEFSRDFRNEGIDRTHNPEFTQVELYKPFWDYNNMMKMAEDMMVGIVGRVHSQLQVPFGDRTIDYSPPWRRLTIYDGIRQGLGVDPETISDVGLKKLAVEHGIKVRRRDRGEILVKLFEKVWERELVDPTFVLDYPAETSALTKRHRTNPALTERFELFVGGMEVMNCYTELNDPRDQRARFDAERAKRRSGDKEAMPFDEDFILSQEYGMPLQAGIGISIDRWTMLLTDTNHIRQAIYFPTLRPRG